MIPALGLYAEQTGPARSATDLGVSPMSKYLKDALERILWTAAQAGVATAIVVLPDAHLPTYLIPIIGSALAAVKVYVAKQFGNPDSASTVPTV